MLLAERRRTEEKVDWRCNGIQMLGRHVRQAMTAMAWRLLLRLVSAAALVVARRPRSIARLRNCRTASRAMDQGNQQPHHYQQHKRQTAEPIPASCTNNGVAIQGQ